MVKLKTTLPTLLLSFVVVASWIALASAQRGCETCNYNFYKGRRGPPGRKGQKGSTGVPGVPGPRGPPGPTGFTGPKGFRGTNGNTGPPGDRGSCFTSISAPGTGIKGDQGGKGVKGQRGPAGAPGPQGPKGMKGRCCTRLIKGSNGVKGSAGTPGEPGTRGATGPKGFKGQMGVTFGLSEQKNFVKRQIMQLQDQIDECCRSPGGGRGKRQLRRTEIKELGPSGPDVSPPGLPGPIPVPSPTRSPKPIGKKFTPGPNGDRGLLGQKGQKGQRGSTGQRGETGPTGPIGNKGRQGDIGFPGSKGPTGPPGTVRDCSPCGQNKGTKGTRGAPGNRGVTGETGSIGPKGMQGRAGSCLKGANGHPGLPGKDGVDGRKGDAGARGQTGEPGDNKPISSPSLIRKLQQTIDIVSRRLSECCSGSRLGRDVDREEFLPPALCEFQFESPESQELPDGLFRPQQISRCPYVRGPPGPPGFSGAKGASGDRGFTGARGPAGRRGSTGDRGSRGPQGLVGPKGNRGRAYFQTCLPRGGLGSPGEQGQKGDQGFPGEIGRRGPQGDACAPSVGPQGDTGETGAPGINGRKGPKGTQGQIGQKGEMALGDITEEEYEKYLDMIQEIIQKIESGGCCSSATCAHNGVEYQHGEQIKPNCTTRCICQNGEWACSRTDCFSGATCTASGDPHYTTFDGTRHHFQGICEYVLAKDCTRNRFTVTTVNTPCGSSSVSCVTEATVVVPNLNLNIVLKRGPQGGQLFVNGVHYPNNGNGLVLSIDEVEIIRSSTSIVVMLTTTGVTVTWRGTTYISVKVSEELKNHLCGLCGTYNDNSADDFQTPDGVVVSTLNAFGFSWLLDGYTITNCTRPPPKPCSATVQQQGAARCNVLRGTYFSACHSIVDPTPYIDDCIFDYCKCPSSQHEECYCDSLENYAKECAAKGVVLNKWKSFYCPVTCPNGMVYQECGTACPNTCKTYADPPVCTDYCVDGCFCPPGQVLLGNTTCVDVKDCPVESCSRMSNVQNFGPGLPVGGTFSNVMIDVGRCSDDCEGRCLPNKTRKETVYLYSGPREVEVIESCQCLSSGGSSCAAVKKEVTYFTGTSCETTVTVNQCVGSCRVDGTSCLPTKEKSVAIENGENGIAVATVIEKCQCVSECYRKSYYEKYREVTSRKEVEIDVGICEGRCSSRGLCRPRKTYQYRGPSLEKDGKPYNPLIIDSCSCTF